MSAFQIQTIESAPEGSKGPLASCRLGAPEVAAIPYLSSEIERTKDDLRDGTAIDTARRDHCLGGALAASAGLSSFGAASAAADLDEAHMVPEHLHLNIGSLLFEDLDQIDLTGPFEVLSRIPNATHRIYARSAAPVRDLQGLRIAPDATLAEAP